MQEQLQYLPSYLGGHLRLVLVALGFGAGISIPLGIVATRFKRMESTILGVAGVIQTIPGLALLAIMVPLLNMIGIIPALVALTLYSLLPILRNTVVGIREIDADIVEAGRGIGMTNKQLLRMVQLPLAIPVIIAGLRTATVWVVGIATLSTPVGATSLGNFIFSGLQTRNNAAILVGCVAAAVLALILDWIIHAFETGVREQNRGKIWIASVASAIVLILAGTLGIGTPGFSAEKDKTITIGSKPFTEQYILSEFLSQYVDREIGYSTEKVQNLGSTVAFDALVENQIDIYVDYSGTLWNMHMKNKEMPTDPDQLLNQLSDYLSEKYGVTVAVPLGFENAYCLAMKGSEAAKLGIEGIDDLRRYQNSLVMGSDVEFFGRPEWSRLQEEYDLHFKATRSMDAVLMYEAIREDQVDVISAYTTDGRIDAYNLTILEDPAGVFPPYDAVVLLSPEMSSSSVLIRNIRKLEDSISAEVMRKMNLEVDQNDRSPQQVGVELYRRIIEQNLR
ncbi:MAG: ABC transporter permease/substrate-binding protein [Candidatus Marinimicrobia bacterium]|nr:ABC transporter permease/substrate-binding protein [Candidatus Neomarinimicrobiota bacterium]MCF7827604.1 ABC transporter permease/substrate-binding protein [Candidatus Neomarinimicrobiota bacterium]MCF7881535.1 ABC transporter permease/substrate-binding protein [Candidatus Neomarinimicrobiota bacterium]